MVVQDGNSAVQKAITQAKTDLSNGIENGADSLKDSINSGVDRLFGQPNSSAIEKETSGTATLMKFTYRDYLMLFTVIGMYTSPDAVLMRTADVIETNMQYTYDPQFTVDKAYTYLECEADYTVKPTLLPLPIFTDVIGNPGTQDLRYLYKYKDVKGY